MKALTTETYRCPYTLGPLVLKATAQEGEEVVAGTLSAGGRHYNIDLGIPRFMWDADETLSDEEKREFSYYESNSAAYDRVMDWLFESFYEDEGKVREAMIDLLEIRPGDRVLETGCGTCRDSERIARRIGRGGQLFLQDFSPRMIWIGRERMLRQRESGGYPEQEFLTGNASRLPFPDGYFDAAFHFGGLNLFSDRASAIKEMARVVKPGGKVVFGDESMAPWLRNTEVGKILLNSNSLYRHEVPLMLIPETASEVCLRWIIGSCFYLVDFRVDARGFRVDLDKPILGARGGTHRTRYYGVLEGVSPETKQLAQDAARAAKLSIHEWLDRAVRTEADLVLGRGDKP